jgi:lysophospholipase L1-like esterase
MSAIDKDLGMATAYAYAVSKGYTGTEEEFAQYIANVGQTAQAAAESAESAARSATTAGQSAESAAQSALEVSGAVTDAEAAATAAGASEAAAVESAANAETEALKSEGHAVGKQDGVDVDAQSEYYQNNSKYYSDRAKDIYDDTVEVRDSIPADYTSLSQDVDDLKADLNNITPEMTTFVDGGSLDPNGNIIVEKNPTLDAYFSGNTGSPVSNQYTSRYLVTDFIPVEPQTTYYFWKPTGVVVFNLCQYNESKEYIPNSQSGNYPSSFTTEATAKYVRISLRDANSIYGTGIIVAIKGFVPTEYIAPTETPYTLKGSDYATESFVKEYVDDKARESNVTLELPERYSIVVDDTFELFWKGVINAVDYENYFVEVICDIGRNYKRKFHCRAAAGDVGTHVMTINLYDSNHNIIDSKAVNLEVCAKATSPASEKVVLYVTDSLGNSGYVPDEFNRRLVGTGGTPTGDGLTNIAFIGDKESVTRQIKFVGNGGWTWASYNASMKTNAFMWVTSNNHDKTINDQHSVYKDSNNTEWKLETIETDKIKIIRIMGSTALPATGTLTWVNGGENHSDIVYAASEQAAGNPFWSETQNKVSFSEFVQSQNKTTLDYVYVLLGWNSTTGSTEATLKSYVRTFLDNILTDYPNCKIVILGIEVPAQDGLGYNYGQNAGILSSYQKSLQFVFNLNKWYYEITQEQAYTGKVTYVNVSGQFDTEYNMPTTTTQVNTRNNTTVIMQSNGVHPAENGYYQIADACYRDFVHKLQE